MKVIHKMYKIERGITKVLLSQKTGNLTEITFEVLKRQLHPLKDPPILFTPNAPQSRMWEKHGVLLLSLASKEAFPSKKVIPNRVRHNPRTTQAAIGKIPESSSKRTMQQQVIW